MGRVKRIWYLSPMRAAKIQASLLIHAVSPEPPLLAHTSIESRGTFRQKARSLASLNGWACAVKICHDGMLEDTNSLDGAQLGIVSCNCTYLFCWIYMLNFMPIYIYDQLNKIIWKFCLSHFLYPYCFISDYILESYMLSNKDSVYTICHSVCIFWTHHCSRAASWERVWLRIKGLLVRATVWPHTFVEIYHEIISTVILPLPLIQEGQMSVSGESRCTKYWLTAEKG